MPISVASEEALAHYTLAVNYLDHAKVKPSWEEFNKAIALDPDFFMAHFRMYFLHSKDSKESSASAFRVSAKLNRGEMELKKALKYLAEGERELCQEHLQNAVDLYPYDPQLRKILYTVQFQFKDYGAAEESMLRTIKYCPDFAPVNNLLGYYYMESGDHEAARKAFDSYIALAPEQANPYDSKGDFFMSQKEFQQAYDSYMKAWEMDPYFEVSKKKAKKAQHLLQMSLEKHEH